MRDLNDSDGSIPILKVEGKGLAEAWENSLLSLYENGCRIMTEYDRPGIDPPSIDATMIFTILDPLSEPMIHRSFPGGLEDLEEYRQEVLLGIKDHWVRDPNNPDDKRWEYTYHERIFRYQVPGIEGAIDQIEAVAQKLAKNPESRRVQAITWKAWEDLKCYDPPCLQSAWFRVLSDAEDTWKLNMNIRFRSRDAYEAAFMNAFALIHLQGLVANRISELAQRPVLLGRYVDISDSYHIYGRKISEFEDRFIKLVNSRTFEDRTWTREFAEPIFEEARVSIPDKIKNKGARPL